MDSTNVVQVFHGIAKRPSIQRCLERQTSRFFTQFMVELNAIKKQFELARRSPPSQPSVPKHAGHAMAAQQLLRRIQSTWEAIEVLWLALAGWRYFDAASLQDGFGSSASFAV